MTKKDVFYFNYSYFHDKNILVTPLPIPHTHTDL